MADKGTNKKVSLGSGHLFYDEFTDEIKTKSAAEIIKQVCVETKRLGYIQGGASVEYTPTFQTEKDDLGIIVKEVMTEEEAIFKSGIFTWNGNTLEKLSSTARVIDDEISGLRVVKIGGVNNDNGKIYVIVFWHKDPKEGDCWLIIVGRNTAGFTLTFQKDSATVIDAEFNCKPQDDEGTLISYVEEIPQVIKDQYTSEDLEKLIEAQIIALAEIKKYVITGDTKEALITDFLAKQAALPEE